MTKQSGDNAIGPLWEPLPKSATVATSPDLRQAILEHPDFTGVGVKFLGSIGFQPERIRFVRNPSELSAPPRRQCSSHLRT